MSVYGKAPLGEGLGPFGGPGLITVLGVLPASNTSYVVVFDRVPKTLDVAAFDDATNPENYTLTAIDPTYTAADGTVVVPEGKVVPTRFPYSALAEPDKVDPQQVEVFADAALEPGVEYQVQVSPSICGADGETFAGPTTFTFTALGVPDTLSPRAEVVEKYRDLDYVISGPAEQTQVYRFDPTGDIGLQDAATSLRKRIYRRVFSDPGAFAWMPDYGVGVKVKALAKAGRLHNLASTVQEQVQREPDVADVGVTVRLDRTPTGAFVNIDLRVLRQDERVVRLSFREAVG